MTVKTKVAERRAFDAFKRVLEQAYLKDGLNGVVSYSRSMTEHVQALAKNYTPRKNPETALTEIATYIHTSWYIQACIDLERQQSQGLVE